MDDHIRAQLERVRQIGRCSGAVHKERKILAMDERSQCGNVHYLQRRVADDLAKDGTGVLVDQRCDLFRGQLVHIAGHDAEVLQIPQQVQGAAKQTVGGDEFIACPQDIQQCHRDSGHAGRAGHRAHAAFQCVDALLKGCNGGVADAGVGKARCTACKDLFQLFGGRIGKSGTLADARQGGTVLIERYAAAVQQPGVKCRTACILFLLTAAHLRDHAAGRGHIGDAVDQDQLSQRAVMGKGVQHDGLHKGEGAQCDLVFAQGSSRLVLTGVHVDGVFDAVQGAGDELGAQLHKEILAGGQRLVVHPEQGGLEGVGYLEVRAVFQHAPTGNIHFFVQLDIHRVSLLCLLHGLVADVDGLDVGLFAAGQGAHVVAHREGARFDLALKAAEGVIRAADPLHRKIEALLLHVGNIHILKMFQQHRAGVPRHLIGMGGHIVAHGGRYRDGHIVTERKLGRQLFNVLFNGAEAGFAVAHKIHLVHRKNEVPNAHEGADAGMAAGLHQQALTGIYQNDCKVGKGSAHGHVAGILLMARGVGHDKAAVVGGEVAVGHINGDALLPLCHQAVQKQRVVNGTAGAAHLGIQFQRLFLIGVQQLCIVEDMADQGRFAIVHAAAGDKFEQAFH